MTSIYDIVTKNENYTNIIKGGYNSYYNYNSIEFVPDTYYDVLKTELLYKYSTI